MLAVFTKSCGIVFDASKCSFKKNMCYGFQPWMCDHGYPSSVLDVWWFSVVHCSVQSLKLGETAAFRHALIKHRSEPQKGTIKHPYIHVYIYIYICYVYNICHDILIFSQQRFPFSNQFSSLLARKQRPFRGSSVKAPFRYTLSSHKNRLEKPTK